MARASATSLPFVPTEPEAGRKRWWLQQTRPCINTEMRPSHHWLLLKWRLESTTIRETGHSAKLLSYTLLRGVSCASMHKGIFFPFFFFCVSDLFNFFSTEPKEAPSDVKAYSISSSEIKLTWKPSPGPGRPKGYEVHMKCMLLLHIDMHLLSSTKYTKLCLWCCQVCYWKDVEQQEAGKKQRTVKNETTTILTGLEGNTLYQFTVKGFNSVGQGPASAAVTAKTRRSRKPSTVIYHMALFTFDLFGWKTLFALDTERVAVFPPAPALPPTNLMWIQEGNNVSLSWDPVKAKENESDVIGYMVKFNLWNIIWHFNTVRK